MRAVDTFLGDDSVVRSVKVKNLSSQCNRTVEIKASNKIKVDRWSGCLNANQNVIHAKKGAPLLKDALNILLKYNK